VTAPVLHGAEAFSAPGGPDGVLVLHGFTGSPFSMRPLAEKLAEAGYAVELPRLPGHGTAVEDMVPTRWSDWSAAAEAAYEGLAGRCRSVTVTGLSMGGTLSCWLAERHPEIRGIAVINPLVEAATDELREAVQSVLDAGTEVMDGIGSDIALPDATELAYLGTPVAPLISLFDATRVVAADLSAIRCPVLLFSSRDDHVVPPSNGDFLAASVSGSCERVWLERSYHVATLDYDREEIERRTVAFVAEVTASARA
jgi:carboxylesterase